MLIDNNNEIIFFVIYSYYIHLIEKINSMNKQANWHNISMLSICVALSEGELSAAKDQLQTLIACKNKPYVLDDHTINRVIKLCGSQKESVRTRLEQCSKWRQQNPSDEQLKDITKMENNINQLETINYQLLELVNRCFKNYTIDAILKKSDTELALYFLSGKLNFDR